MRSAREIWVSRAQSAFGQIENFVGECGFGFDVALYVVVDSVVHAAADAIRRASLARAPPSDGCQKQPQTSMWHGSTTEPPVAAMNAGPWIEPELVSVSLK